MSQNFFLNLIKISNKTLEIEKVLDIFLKVRLWEKNVILEDLRSAKLSSMDTIVLDISEMLLLFSQNLSLKHKL